MAETKYARIHTEQDVHTEQEEEDELDNLDGTTATVKIVNEKSYNFQQPNQHSSISTGQTTTMIQTPSAMLALIFIYFGLSIGLTFYQRGLLKVRRGGNGHEK